MSDTHDNPWREPLDAYFPDFLALCFPRLHGDVDWAHGWRSLDREASEVFRDGDRGGRAVDTLTRVQGKNGGERIVHVHVELEGGYDADFPRRMFVSNIRLLERQRRPVVSLAVLADDRPGWRPESFRFRQWGCDLAFRFPRVKLWDYYERWPELEASRNPFATAVLAHLKARATRLDPRGRLDWKILLVRSLCFKGYPRQDVGRLYRFIDRLLRLPPELQQQFEDDVARFFRKAEGMPAHATGPPRRSGEATLRCPRDRQRIVI